MIDLMKLKYEYSDLEPFIDKETVEIHYSKHHSGYVNNLNNLIKKTDLLDKSLEDILLNINTLDSSIKNGVNNNAGGVYMHNVYFSQFSKSPNNLESNILLDEIKKEFNDFENMIDILKSTALTTFGSGWSALVINNKTKNTKIISITNQNVAAILEEFTPIVVLDVWEHVPIIT